MILPNIRSKTTILQVIVITVVMVGISGCSDDQDVAQTPISGTEKELDLREVALQTRWCGEPRNYSYGWYMKRLSFDSDEVSVSLVRPASDRAFEFREASIDKISSWTSLDADGEYAQLYVSANYDENKIEETIRNFNDRLNLPEFASIETPNLQLEIRKGKDSESYRSYIPCESISSEINKASEVDPVDFAMWHFTGGDSVGREFIEKPIFYKKFIEIQDNKFDLIFAKSWCQFRYFDTIYESRYLSVLTLKDSGTLYFGEYEDFRRTDGDLEFDEKFIEENTRSTALESDKDGNLSGHFYATNSGHDFKATRLVQEVESGNKYLILGYDFEKPQDEPEPSELYYECDRDDWQLWSVRNYFPGSLKHRNEIVKRYQRVLDFHTKQQ